MRRMQAATPAPSSENSGITLSSDGGANLSNYKNTGLDPISALTESSSSKLVSIMTTLALALYFIIN